MKKFYTINIYCIDEDSEVHCLTFTEKCKNENEKNALIKKSFDYAMNKKYSVYLYTIDTSTDEEIISYRNKKK